MIYAKMCFGKAPDSFCDSGSMVRAKMMKYWIEGKPVFRSQIRPMMQIDEVSLWREQLELMNGVGRYKTLHVSLDACRTDSIDLL